jgi:hypothetical protein
MKMLYIRPIAGRQRVSSSVKHAYRLPQARKPVLVPGQPNVLLVAIFHHIGAWSSPIDMLVNAQL